MSDETEIQIRELMLNALSKRQAMITPGHDCALRIFNGFYEGERDLVADLMAALWCSSAMPKTKKTPSCFLNWRGIFILKHFRGSNAWW